jgi:hypothetical protein
MPAAQPAHAAQWPCGHCASLVHQQATPAAAQVPEGDVTVLQLPSGQAHVFATDCNVRQFSLSADPEPVQAPPAHWLSVLTHFALEQLLSATQRHAEWSELSTGAGVSVVVHELPPLPVQGTELGAGTQPWPSSCEPALPVQLEQLPFFPLGMQCPLAQATSSVQ